MSSTATSKMQEVLSYLHRWRKLGNAYTNNFLWSFDENSRQWPPVRVSMDPPPSKEETWPPLQMPPPLSKEEARPLTWGGGGSLVAQTPSSGW